MKIEDIFPQTTKNCLDNGFDFAIDPLGTIHDMGSERTILCLAESLGLKTVKNLIDNQWIIIRNNGRHIIIEYANTEPVQRQKLVNLLQSGGTKTLIVNGKTIHWPRDFLLLF